MLSGMKTTEGKEYKILKTKSGCWAVFVSVKYPSGDHNFWQQTSKEYTYRKWAIKNMLNNRNNVK